MSDISEKKRVAAPTYVPEQRHTPDEVLLAFSLAFDVSIQDLRSPNREQPLGLRRQSAYLGLRLWTTLSYPRIADAFNGRDHTSILHGVNEAAKRLFADIEPVSSLLERNGVLGKYQKEKDLIVRPFEMVASALEALRFQTNSRPEIRDKFDQLISRGLIAFEEDHTRGHKNANIIVKVTSGAMLVKQACSPSDAFV